MFLTYKYGKMLQFPMGLASAYSWVLNTHRRTEQRARALSPLAEAGLRRHGELMRSSLAWGEEQRPQQQQLPL